MDKKYTFIPLASMIFRIFGWIILIAGIVLSILVGFFGLASNVFMGDTLSASIGVLPAIIGIVYSILTWVSFLTIAELLNLLVDIERNTRLTTDQLTKQIQD